VAALSTGEKREPLYGGAGPEPVRHDPTLGVDERQGVGAGAWNPQLDRTTPSSGISSTERQRRAPRAANRPRRTDVVGASQGAVTSFSTARSVSSVGMKLSSTIDHVRPRMPARGSFNTRYASANASPGESE